MYGVNNGNQAGFARVEVIQNGGGPQQGGFVPRPYNQPMPIAQPFPGQGNRLGVTPIGNPPNHLGTPPVNRPTPIAQAFPGQGNRLGVTPSGNPPNHLVGGATNQGSGVARGGGQPGTGSNSSAGGAVAAFGMGFDIGLVIGELTAPNVTEASTNIAVNSSVQALGASHAVHNVALGVIDVQPIGFTPNEIRQANREIARGNGSGRNTTGIVMGPLLSYHNVSLDIGPDSDDPNHALRARQILNSWVELIRTHRVGHLFLTEEGIRGHVMQLQQELTRLTRLIDGRTNQDVVQAIVEAEDAIYNAVKALQEGTRRLDFLGLRFELNRREL